MRLRSVRRKAEPLVHGVVNTILVKLIPRGNYDLARTLVVAGMNRSGSTWLAEIVSAHPSAGQIFEPLHPEHVKAAWNCGFSRDLYVSGNVEWREGEEFFRKVLSGQIVNPWTLSQLPIWKVIRVRFWVVKLVRANLLLGWLTKTFPIKPPVLVMRHPCAVVASQLRKGWIPSKKRLLEISSLGKLLNLQEVREILDTPEALLAAKWCILHYVPLALPQPFPFVLTTYEKLVQDGEREVRRIFAKWGMEAPEQSIARLRRPSRTVSSASAVVTGKDPLLSWREDLTSAQVHRILELVRKFGLSFYNEEAEPDYDFLEDLEEGRQSLQFPPTLGKL